MFALILRVVHLIPVSVTAPILFMLMMLIAFIVEAVKFVITERIPVRPPPASAHNRREVSRNTELFYSLVASQS